MSSHSFWGAWAPNHPVLMARKARSPSPRRQQTGALPTGESRSGGGGGGKRLRARLGGGSLHEAAVTNGTQTPHTEAGTPEPRRVGTGFYLRLPRAAAAAPLSRAEGLREGVGGEAEGRTP